MQYSVTATAPYRRRLRASLHLVAAVTADTLYTFSRKKASRQALLRVRFRVRNGLLQRRQGRTIF